MNFFEGPMGVQLQRAMVAVLWLFALLLVVGIVYLATLVRYAGEGITPSDTITVSGTGNAYAIPDTAGFSFSVVADATTVAAAQSSAAQKINTLTQYLTQAGVSSDDIQTTDYEIYPTYKNEPVACPLVMPSGGASVSPNMYCQSSGNQIQTGYEVEQTTEVKVSNTSQAGTLLGGVGQKGATNISGLSFTVADPSAVEAQARAKAIADAQETAQALAQELGVSLMGVVSFNENQGGLPTPIYSMAAASGANASISPTISTGQNEVTDNVSITYQIH